MDAVCFNTSVHLQDTVGATWTRLVDKSTRTSLALLIGGQRAASSSGQLNHASGNYMHVDVLDIKAACWRQEYVVTNKAKNRAFHAAAVISTPVEPAEGPPTEEGTKSQQIVIIGGGSIDRIGTSPAPVLVPSRDVLVVDKGMFGFKMTTLFEDQEGKLAFVGLSASTMGKYSDRVVVFGGYDPVRGAFNEQLQLFVPSATPQLRAVEIDPACAQPPHRAYHSAVVLGSEGQYLLVMGGEGAGRKAQADMWLLDMTDVLQAEYNPEPAAAEPANSKDKKAAAGKAGKDGKDANKPPVYGRWFPVPDAVEADGSRFSGARSRSQPLVLPRTSSAESVECELWMLGGLTQTEGGLGLTPLAAIERASLVIGAAPARPAVAPAAVKGAAPSPPVGPQVVLSPLPAVNVAACPGVVAAARQADDPGAHPSVRALNFFASARGMALATCVVDEGDFQESAQGVLGLLVTGGLRLGAPGPPSVVLLVPDGSHRLLRRVKRAVQRNYALEGLEIPRDCAEDQAESLPRHRRIEYRNGDVYEGMTRATQSIAFMDSPGSPSSGLFSASATFGSEAGLADDEGDAPRDQSRGVEGLHFPDGQGRMDYHAGGHYEGLWTDGVRCGFGRLEYPNGDVYDGDFASDAPEGTGVFTSAHDGSEYNGDFVGGQFHGGGELRSPARGEVFHGRFERGLRHGPGVISYLDEAGGETGEMVGTWAHDEMLGAGQASNFSISSLNLLRGYYPKDQLFLEEQGVNSVMRSRVDRAVALLSHLAPRIPGSYSGPMLHGQPEGNQGACQYVTGDSYLGQWRKGRRNGAGRYTYANGDLYEGKWVGDVPCGFGRFQTLLGDVYEGQWENNAYHGRGALICKKEGTCYAGEFARGKRHGEGKLLDEGTQRVLEEGTYANDKLLSKR